MQGLMLGWSQLFHKMTKAKTLTFTAFCKGFKNGERTLMLYFFLNRNQQPKTITRCVTLRQLVEKPNTTEHVTLAIVSASVQMLKF